MIFRETISFTRLSKRKFVRPSWEQKRIIAIYIYINVRGRPSVEKTQEEIVTWVTRNGRVSVAFLYVREQHCPTKGDKETQHRMCSHQAAKPGLGSDEAAGWRVGWMSSLRLLKALWILWVFGEFVGVFHLAEDWVDVPTEAAQSTWDPLDALGICWGIFHWNFKAAAGQRREAGGAAGQCLHEESGSWEVYSHCMQQHAELCLLCEWGPLATKRLCFLLWSGCQDCQGL